MPPRLKNNQALISGIFCLLGVGLLVPWNAFISAKPYFESRLCGPSRILNTNVALLFSIFYTLSSVLSLVVLLIIQNRCNNFDDNVAQREKEDGGGRSGEGLRLATERRTSSTTKRPSLAASVRSVAMNTSSAVHPMSASLRTSQAIAESLRSLIATNGGSVAAADNKTFRMVMVPLGIFVAVFVLTAMFVLVPSIPANTVLAVSLASLSICGTCQAVAASGIMGTAGLFKPEVAIYPHLEGYALSGLFVSVANLIAAYCGDPSLYRKHICGEGSSGIGALPEASTQGAACVPYATVSWATFGYFALGSLIFVLCIFGYGSIQQSRHLVQKGAYTPIENITENVQRPSTSTAFTEKEPTNNYLADLERSDSMDDFVALLAAIRAPASTIFLVFTLTLSIFPVITSDLSSCHECEGSTSRLRNDLFTPLGFVIFNAGDLIGRMIAGRVPLDDLSKHPNRLVWMSVARFAFVPLFLVCNSRKFSSFPITIRSDIFSWLVQALLALSNGLVVSLSFAVAPSLIPETTEMQQLSSSVLNLCLSGGLLAGSFLSFGMLHLFLGFFW